MNLNEFVSIVSRGLQRGFRCLIDGREFLESEQVTRAEAERLCRQHVAALVDQQDTVMEDDKPVLRLRPERTLAERKAQFASHGPSRGE